MMQLHAHLILTALLCLATVSEAYKAPVTLQKRHKAGDMKIVRATSLSLSATPAPSVTASSATTKRVYSSKQTIMDKIIIVWMNIKIMIDNNVIAFCNKVTELLGLRKGDKKIVDLPPKASLSTVFKMWKNQLKNIAISNIDSKDDASIKVTVKKVDDNQWVEKKLKEIEILEVGTKAAVTRPVTEAQGTTGPYDINAVMSSDFIPSIIKVPRQNGGKSFDVVKTKGTSGIVSYVITEVMFWALAIPIIIASYHGSNEEWLNFANPEDRSKILALAGVYVTSIRLAVPFRLALAVAIIPWVEKNITNNFINKDTKT